ncbi:MAG: dihydrolipoyl dehydrogenase [Nitrospirae bacterium]|nr:dihydrolipoyl dehydrogenase [Nitrospirota bacterium]
MPQMKIAVVGSGPGGYVAALRAARLGAAVTLIEKERLGGTCLQKGCIPTKALAASARIARNVRRAGEFGIRLAGEPEIDFAGIQQRARKIVAIQEKGIRSLLESWGVDVIQGMARLDGNRSVVIESGSEDRKIAFDRVILATGSKPAGLPGIPIDGERILDSDALVWMNVLPERILIIGGGVIGCEFASIFASLGVKVLLVEALERILAIEDEEVSALLAKEFKKQGIEVETGTMVKSVNRDGSAVRVEFGEGRTESFETVALTVGRRPRTGDLGLEEAGVRLAGRGEVVVDASMRTSKDGVYAVGDMTGGLLLAHTASHQGLAAAHHAVTEKGEYDPTVVPWAVFTYPEVGRAGLTEREAREKFGEVRIGRFQFRGLGKAHAIGEIAGLAKIVATGQGQIVGAHVIGAEASDIVQEMALAIGKGMTLADIAQSIHIHPTLSEIVGEAALSGLGMGIHEPKERSEIVGKAALSGPR